MPRFSRKRLEKPSTCRQYVASLLLALRVVWTFVHRWRGRRLEEDLQCSLYMDHDIRTLKRDSSEATTEVVEPCEMVSTRLE